jgi:hypothetical protein
MAPSPGYAPLSLFVSLSLCRERVAAALGLPADDLELSMGMSGDYEQAVSGPLHSCVVMCEQLLHVPAAKLWLWLCVSSC